MERVGDFAALSDRVSERFDGLSPQLQKAARFLLRHPDDVALRSMRALSHEAAVPAVTFVRLSRALGFADYKDLRSVFQNRVRRGEAGTRYGRRARALQRRDGGESGALLKALLGAELDNVELTFERNDAALLSDAIRRIEDAKRVLVLGQRSCFPIAFFFTYVYRLFRTNSVLLQNQLGSVIDDLRDIGPRDLLIAISIAPYAAETIQAVEYARERRARIVAITDDPLSPIARAADVVLPVAVGTPSFFHSTTAIMALAQALLALLVARGGAPALAALDLSEKQLARFNAYWHPTPARPTPPRPLSTRGKPS